MARTQRDGTRRFVRAANADQGVLIVVERFASTLLKVVTVMVDDSASAAPIAA